MKNLTIFLWFTFVLYGLMQTRMKTTNTVDDIDESIKDNGRSLHIRIKSSKSRKEINYDHTFDVYKMSQKQKNDLVKRINDSLGIIHPAPPAPPAPPRRHLY